MACGPFTSWSPIPSGSRICARVTANGDDFVVIVRVVPSSGAGMTFGTAALLNVPACAPLDSTEGYRVQGIITICPEAPTVTLEITMVDAIGDVIRHCDWTFNQTGKFHVMVALVP